MCNSLWWMSKHHLTAQINRTVPHSPKTSYFSFCRLSICSVRIRSSCCIASCCCSFRSDSGASPPPALSPSTTGGALGLRGGERVWLLLFCRTRPLLCKFTQNHIIIEHFKVWGWVTVTREMVHREQTSYTAECLYTACTDHGAFWKLWDKRTLP